MKKTKQPPTAATPAIETFGGDFHKFESTFQPYREPAVHVGAGKRKPSNPARGKRKDGRAPGT